MALLAVTLAMAVGTDCGRGLGCCYTDDTITAKGYYNSTNQLCFTNSTCTASGACSKSALCDMNLNGLPSAGSDLGGLLTGIAPGVGTFIIILAIFGGIGALIYAIVGFVKGKVSKD